MSQRNVLNAFVVIAVIGIVAAVAWYKTSRVQTDGAASPPATQPTSAPATSTLPAKMLPRVVDLGADKCVACKKLAPILEELKAEYAGRAVVEFIDVWKDPAAGEKYNIRLIPTQIFFDRDGNEVWRHEGFLSKKEFVTKLAELGAK